MHTRNKRRARLYLPYVGLIVLVLVTVALVAYLIGTPGWDAPIMPNFD